MKYRLHPAVVAIALASLMTVSDVAIAQTPRLDRIDRGGGQRGSEFTMHCHGERLEGIDDVLFYRPGLTLKSVTAVDSSCVDITLLASDDCALGEHPVRLLGPSGVTELRTVHVGPYPHIEEQEPNNRITNAQAISSGVTVCGVIDEGDVDSFRVPLNQGQRISAEVVGLRLSAYLFDPWLGIRDSEGQLVAASDDTALHRQDPIVSFVAPRDDDYFVEIRESAFGGDLDSVYQLHIGGHPRPTVAYPAGGPRGQELAVELIGDGSGPISQRIQLPGDSTDSMVYFPEDGAGIAPSPIQLRVSDFPNVLEQEPNQSSVEATATGIAPGFALNGVLQVAGDRDVFVFPARAGQRFDVEAFAMRIGSPVDSVVSIRGPDESEIVRNDDGARHDSVLRFTAPVDGDYTLSISDHLDRGGADYVYRIEFLPVRPRLELTIPVLSQRQQQLRQAISIGRGNRFTLLVAARRTNLSGELRLHVEGLPEGVTATASRIEADSHLGYIVFEAGAQARLSRGLIRISGTCETESGTVTGQLVQETGLVFGEPRQSIYHAIEVDQIPLVVTESAPFTLEVDAPQVPLVRDGLLNLQVEAHRAPGVVGEITLSLPFLPPWIEVPENAVTIPEGESRAIFPVRATIEAAPRDWQIVVMGEVDVDGQSQFVSSAPFALAVAEPFVSLAMIPAVTEQGSPTRIVCDLDWKQPVDAPVLARLHGLPKNATAPELQLTGDTRQITFPIAVGVDTPASIHNTLFVELAIDPQSEAITHFLGRGGALEVYEQGKHARQTLSRLEILRRQARRESTAAVSENTTPAD